MTRLAASALALVAAFAPVFAAAQASPLVVQNAWMRKVPGSDTAAMYLVLRNTAAQPVIVIGVRSPVASHVTVHETTTSGGQSQMRAYEKLVIAPGQSLVFEPGGLHVMLSGFKQSITVGQTVPLILLLANGGQVQASAVVRPPGAP